MAIIILEGLDRTGKSSVAKEFQKQGFELVHMSAPAKELSAPGYTGPSYLDQMVDMLQSFATKDVVLDRSHYGELIWPKVYDRKPHLTEEDMEILRELEQVAGVRRILMMDPNVEAHWQRCVDNKEPLTKAQFLRARSLYSSMAHKYEFEVMSLPKFLENIGRPEDAANLVNNPQKPDPNVETTTTTTTDGNSTTVTTVTAPKAKKQSEMEKLETANAINDVLSKRLLKSKGLVYDALENDIRGFLKDKLGRIFGENSGTSFSEDEVKILKLFCDRLKEKETKK